MQFQMNWIMTTKSKVMRYNDYMGSCYTVVLAVTLKNNKSFFKQWIY